jgi:hypothetical protein
VSRLEASETDNRYVTIFMLTKYSGELVGSSVDIRIISHKLFRKTWSGDDFMVNVLNVSSRFQHAQKGKLCLPSSTHVPLVYNYEHGKQPSR